MKRRCRHVVEGAKKEDEREGVVVDGVNKEEERERADVWF